MTKGTLTRVGLQDAVRHSVGNGRVDAAGLDESVLGHISDALANGESLKIIQFGRFDVLDKAPRMGRNLQTGQRRPIPAMRSLRFRPASAFQDRVATVGRALER